MKSLQLDSPHAIIVIGIQGSGKTFFAHKFADTFKAPFIEQSLFTDAAAHPETGAALFETVIKEVAKTGRSLVIELSLSSRTERSDLARDLKQAGYTPLFVWVQVDTETAMARTYKTSKLSAADYQERASRFSQPHPSEKALVISGKHTFATQAKAVLRRLTVPRTSRPSPVQPAAEQRPQQPPRGQIIVR